MWYFVSPQIVFGDGAMTALDDLKGSRALIVTDGTLVQLGLVDQVKARLERAGFQVHIFDRVRPDPDVETVLEGAEVARTFEPDWIVGVGGGSPLDAAKAIWVLYERPDLHPAEINPITPLGLRCKARMVAIPTTSGTGSEATMGIVLTDREECRKMGLGNREAVPDIAIVDPRMAAAMPPQLTADTGLDALVHAIEGYTCAWHTDFADGLCFNAARLIFRYLPAAVANGADLEAREHMHNAATCAGLGFSNSLTSIAHSMGHALGAAFHIHHGRAVGICLPYTIEFAASQAPERYADLAALLGFSQAGGEEGARALARAVRDLCRRIGNPTCVAETGLPRADYEAQLDKLVDDAFNDTSMMSAVRSPSYDEFRRLFIYAYEGKPVDF